MSNIFDINTINCCYAGEVVRAMHEMTSEDGKLYAVPYNGSCDVPIIGFYDCNMSMEEWDAEYQEFADAMDNLVDDLIRKASGEAAYSVVVLQVEDNVFAPVVRRFERRLTRLVELGAPECVIMEAIKALALYYVLNRYCITI